MMENIGLEYLYIKLKKQYVDNIIQQRENQGYYKYKPGDKVICHLDFGKTSLGFMKKRKTFEHEATFINYEHCNSSGTVKLIHPLKTSTGKILDTITLPIIYIKPLN